MPCLPVPCFPEVPTEVALLVRPIVLAYESVRDAQWHRSMLLTSKGMVVKGREDVQVAAVVSEHNTKCRYSSKLSHQKCLQNVSDTDDEQKIPKPTHRRQKRFLRPQEI